MSSLKFQSVSFTYPSSAERVLHNISFELFPGWFGLTGVNGSGKTTLMKLAAGLLVPDSGKIMSPPSSYCPQETAVLPPGWEDFTGALYDRDNGAGRLFSLLRLDHDWPWRWETLSQGERKRFQLAVFLWRERDLLLVDEPTNHLDSSSRQLILETLGQYGGIGLIVSHDRDFMDNLCKAHLFLRKGEARLRPGTLTACMEEENRETEALSRQHNEAAREVARLERESRARRTLAEGQQRRRSKAGLDIKDHDSRFKKNLARISGKDGTGGRLLRQMDGRISQAEDRLSSLRTEGIRKTGITQKTSVYKGDRILSLEEGVLELNDNKRLYHKELIIRPGDRIALTGDNGTGKSTLIRTLLKGASPDRKILYIPQETGEREKKSIKEDWEEMSPHERGALISYFSRLGGNPDQFLTSGHLSPGEERKLLIARGLLTEPVLIILDEPTNHLDLDSITILESALVQTDTALLLVSHDSRFRRRLTGTEWRLTEEGEDIRLFWDGDQAL